MGNVGIVAENLEAAVEFCSELGLILEGRMTIAGDWADHSTALVNSLGSARNVRRRRPSRHADQARQIRCDAGDKVVNYQNSYRLCYIRNLEGITIGLAWQFGKQTDPEYPMEENTELRLRYHEQKLPFCRDGDPCRGWLDLPLRSRHILD